MEELINKIMDWLTEKSDEVHIVTIYGKFVLLVSDVKTRITKKFGKKKETTLEEKSKVESKRNAS